MIRVKRLIKSFAYAFRGFFKVLAEEQNLKIQTFSGIVVIFLGWYFKIDKFEWIALVLSIGLVILAETINSAVERVSDLLKPRINNYVKEIKDIMAAAVMLSSIVAIIIGLIVFLPRIML